MALSEKQKKYLRGLGHKRQPIVRVGQNGLSENVVLELERALKHHELVKTRIAPGDRAERDQAIVALCERCRCELVQRVGNMALFYRRNRKRPVIVFPAGSGRAAAGPPQT